jgi:tetratricopeptide (TPR) repeat protein
MSAPASRRRRVLGGLLLLAALAAAGLAVYHAHFRHTPPTPPDVDADDNDPAVAGAVRVVRERIMKEPRSAQAWGDLGETFIANDLEEKSGVCFAEAEHLDPANPRWPYFRAGPLVFHGDRREAVPHLARAADLCDAGAESNPAPRLLLAETLLALGRLDDAEQHFRRVVARRADEPRAHYGLGLLAVAREDWKAARDHFLRCLGSPQARQKASVQLAAVSRRLGDPAGAERFQGQADRFQKDLDWADPFMTESLRWAVRKSDRYRLVEQLEAAGRLADAAAILRPMTEEYPDDYFPHLTLGRHALQMGDEAGAERSLRRALQLAPDKYRVRYMLSLALMTKGEDLARRGDPEQAAASFREATEQARQALAIAPDSGPSYMCLGRSLQHLGERPAAIDALRRAVRCNPELAELHYYLGDILADDGQEAEARRCLQQALDFAPPGVPQPWQAAAQTRLAGLKAAHKD